MFQTREKKNLLSHRRPAIYFQLLLTDGHIFLSTTNPMPDFTFKTPAVRWITSLTFATTISIPLVTSYEHKTLYNQGKLLAIHNSKHSTFVSKKITWS